MPTVTEFIAGRIASVYPEAAAERMGAIREGFNGILPIEYLRRNFNPVDIHTLVVGDPEISVKDLQANTEYSNG